MRSRGRGRQGWGTTDGEGQARSIQDSFGCRSRGPSSMPAPWLPQGGPLGSLPTPLPDSLQEPLVDVGGSHAPKPFRGKFFILVFVECDRSIRSTQRVEGATGQPRGWKGRKRETEGGRTSKLSKGPKPCQAAGLARQT